jgi:hypothetical protein
VKITEISPLFYLMNPKKLCSKCYIQKNKNDWINKEKNNNIISFENFNPKYFSSKIEMKNYIKQLLPKITNFFVWNKDGYSRYHWFTWFISTNNKEYADERIKYIWFFECLQELLSKELFYQILVFGTKLNSKWTVLHHLLDECVNVNVVHIKKFMIFLINSGLNMDMEDDEGITPNIIIQKKIIEKKKSEEIKKITAKYKELENILKKDLLENYSKYFNICNNCNYFISYLSDLKVLSQYFLNNKDEHEIFLQKYKVILEEIIENREKALELFQSLSFSELEEVNDSNKQHKHVINLYKSLLEKN